MMPHGFTPLCVHVTSFLRCMWQLFIASELRCCESRCRPSLDVDGDGVPAAEDYDDGDSTVHPGAAGVCDGKDNNCSGEIDDGIPTDGSGCQDSGMPEAP
ncbi:MAG: hypothetical protein GY811_24695 [Myxococcales bacterium]|nr:hypothetical protein [Myxococcales bacterium]